MRPGETSRPPTVVGIAPEGFRGHRPLGAGTDLWLPMTQAPFIVAEDAEHDRAMNWMLVLGRLRDGADVSEANAALQTVFARLSAEHAEIDENEGARAPSFVAAVLILLFVIVGASLAPARRAAAVHPVEALRWQ